jgi:uncharacterized protein (TIGR02757 family)
MAGPQGQVLSAPVRKRYERVLEDLYQKLNRRAFLDPDPLLFLHQYGPADREVVGLIASALAYGNVKQIMASVGAVLARMGPAPAEFVRSASQAELATVGEGFKHRWTSGREVVDLLGRVRAVLTQYGSLGMCLARHVQDEHETVRPALEPFARLLGADEGVRNSLISLPSRPSACKRLHLYLRWMVRRDDVDPGGWSIDPAKLIVPLDTHMHRIGLRLGLTRRKQADGRAAMEMTCAFRAIRPDDPVRYDFALTRLGIRSDTNLEDFLSAARGSASLPVA